MRCICVQVGLDEPRTMGLDDSLEYINDDEQVEVRRSARKGGKSGHRRMQGRVLC